MIRNSRKAIVILAALLFGPASAEVFDVTITADATPDPYYPVFGQTETAPATVSFRLDTSNPIIVTAGTLLGPFQDDYYLTDLYGYQLEALSNVSATFGNKNWDESDVFVGPFGGYAPNPSAAVWFDGPVTDGGSAIPNILFWDSDGDSYGRLDVGHPACGWADLNGACRLVDRVDVMDEITFGSAFSTPLNISVSVVGPVAPALTCEGFEAPMDSHPVTVSRNRALPLGAQLFGADSSPVSNMDIVAAPVVQVLYDSGVGGDPVDVTDYALPAGLGTDGNTFEFTGSLKWRYNIKTKNYSAPGTYTINIVSGDDAEYVINPPCVTSFVIN